MRVGVGKYNLSQQGSVRGTNESKKDQIEVDRFTDKDIFIIIRTWKFIRLSYFSLSSLVFSNWNFNSSV